MRYVITSGKTLEEAPIPESRKKELSDYAKRISDFEILVSKNIPEPEKASEVDVSIDPLLVRLWLLTVQVLLSTSSFGRY